ncbi:BglG family transcription antiterminator [Neobacillus niacini]|uniref:BglG family transcription antiterminator n=1 Tax=Neobacillus niacini TaxID=86668 RepID=UPI0021CB5B82|nr:PTS sugar transporter subunit IIA [Neobacillus niacini]MCM3763643.1 PTS sugar transporter subunit IIA [Neobacillus niacini]
MIQLDRQFCLFLKVLNTSKTITNISKMAESVNLSRRMIYYYLEKVDDMFASEGLEPVNRSKSEGLSLTLEQMEKVDEWLENSVSGDYFLTTDERRQVILMLIMASGKSWYIQDFIDLMQVSRTTILTDIQYIKKKVSQYEKGLELKSNKKQGYYVDLDEFVRRRIIFKIIQEMGYKQNTQAFMFCLDQMSYDFSSWAIDSFSDATRVLSECIRKTEKILNKTIAEQDVKLLAKTSIIYLIRSLRGHRIHWTNRQKKVVKMRKEYKAACTLLEIYKTIVKQPIDDEEAVFYGMLLLCAQKNSDTHYKSKSFEEIANITTDLIASFQTISGIYFKDKDRLFENVQTHLKVLFYRHEFEFFHTNLSLKDVMTKYKKVYLLTKKVIGLFKSQNPKLNRFIHRLTDDEIASLALYFEEGILREQSKKTPFKILIVSDYASVYTSLLETQIKQLLPDAAIEAVLTCKDALAFSKPVNYCLTTDQSYVHATGETIYVKPILSNEDKERILNISKGSALQLNRRQQLIDILSQNNMPLDKKIAQIEGMFLGEWVEVSRSRAVSLTDVFDEEHIFYVNHIHSIEAAVDILSVPLLKKRHINERYIQQIKREIADKNRLLFIYPSVLLLHTDYRNGSYEPGISMLYTENTFLMEKEPFLDVRFIILLATEEKMTHVPLLFELDQLLNGGFLEELLEGKDITEAFHEIMTRVK